MTLLSIGMCVQMFLFTCLHMHVISVPGLLNATLGVNHVVKGRVGLDLFTKLLK